jgi:hypothetical protein
MSWRLPEVFGRKPTPQSIRRRSNNNRYETGRPQHVGKPTLAELQTKLDGVRREVRNLTVMGMDPKAATRAGKSSSRIWSSQPELK